MTNDHHRHREPMIRVEHGDMLEVIPRLVAEGIIADAIVTDPPYGLKFMGKRWDDLGSFVERRPDRQIAFDRVGGNHNPINGLDRARTLKVENVRAQCWHEEWAATAFEILRPGGFMLVFGGTRTQHRMVCAIEDAGFVIQDTICWLHGQGFPKHRSHLKPAVELICVAYKPGGERTLGVDECRIPTNGEDMGDPARFIGVETNRTNGWDRPHKHDADDMLRRKIETAERTSNLGRWPANVIHDDSDEVMAAFAAFGPKTSGILKAGTQRNSRSVCYGEMPKVAALQDFGGDAGSASRFFYTAKADAQDRWGSRHPTVKPVALIRYLVQLVCPPGGLFLDPFAGSGTAAVAALATGRDAILIEQDQSYVADIRERVAFYEGEGRHSLVAKNRNRREAAGTLL